MPSQIFQAWPYSPAKRLKLWRTPVGFEEVPRFHSDDGQRISERPTTNNSKFGVEDCESKRPVWWNRSRQKCRKRRKQEFELCK